MMLLHIIPRLYVVEPDTPRCKPTDFHCPDLDVKLRNGIKTGRKVIQGILIETTQRVRQFTTSTCWAIGTDRIASHQVQYLVIDDELDAVTDSIVLWSGMSPSLSSLGARWPSSAKGWAPAVAQPRMELISRECVGHYADRTNSTRRILERCEVFQMPMAEREYVLHSSKSDIYARIPTVDMAFTVSV